MTQPEQPLNYLNTVLPSDAEFGPDHAADSGGLPFDVPRSDPSASKPRNGRKVNGSTNSSNQARGGIFNNLGQNKKARSPVRKLTQEDIDKIESAYGFIAMGVMPFRPRAAQTIMAQANKCANAWAKLADQNDSVRRFLLGSMEGGGWLALAFAHMPILVSLVPEDSLPERFQQFDISQFMNMSNDVPDTPEGIV